MLGFQDFVTSQDTHNESVDEFQIHCFWLLATIGDTQASFKDEKKVGAICCWYIKTVEEGRSVAESLGVERVGNA